MTYVLQEKQTPEGLQLGGVLEGPEVGKRDLGSGCLETKGSLFPRPLVPDTFSSAHLCSPSGTPDDDHIYMPLAFPCCYLSHHSGQLFSPCAGPAIQRKWWSCHQRVVRPGRQSQREQEV